MNETTELDAYSQYAAYRSPSKMETYSERVDRYYSNAGTAVRNSLQAYNDWDLLQTVWNGAKAVANMGEKAIKGAIAFVVSPVSTTLEAINAISPVRDEVYNRSTILDKKYTESQNKQRENQKNLLIQVGDNSKGLMVEPKKQKVSPSSSQTQASSLPSDAVWNPN